MFDLIDFIEANWSAFLQHLQYRGYNEDEVENEAEEILNKLRGLN